MNEKARALIEFVISENRVWPKRWHDFYVIIRKTHPNAPRPLILGGSIASDLAKRIVLLEQIHEVKDDPVTLDRADAFLRGEPDSAWHRAPDPLSNRDIYGYEEISFQVYLDLLPQK